MILYVKWFFLAFSLTTKVKLKQHLLFCKCKTQNYLMKCSVAEHCFVMAWQSGETNVSRQIFFFCSIIHVCVISAVEVLCTTWHSSTLCYHNIIGRLLQIWLIMSNLQKAAYAVYDLSDEILKSVRQDRTYKPKWLHANHPIDLLSFFNTPCVTFWQCNAYESIKQ